MPEGRGSPWKYLPRSGARLSVTFGEPLSPAAVRATLGMGSRNGEEGKQRSGQAVNGAQAGAEETRIALTELVQRAVEVLGRQVSGDLLTGLPYQQQQQT